MGRVEDLVGIIKDLVLDLKDGFGITLRRGKKAPVMAVWDFVRGVDKSLDLMVLIDPEVDAEHAG